MFISTIEPVTKLNAGKKKFQNKPNAQKSNSNTARPAIKTKSPNSENHTNLAPQTLFDVALLSSDSSPK